MPAIAQASGIEKTFALKRIANIHMWVSMFIHYFANDGECARKSGIPWICGFYYFASMEVLRPGERGRWLQPEQLSNEFHAGTLGRSTFVAPR